MKKQIYSIFRRQPGTPHGESFKVASDRANEIVRLTPMIFRDPALCEGETGQGAFLAVCDVIAGEKVE